MQEQMKTTGEGFSVLDGVALVVGAAVASVHLRCVISSEPVGGGWVIVWGTFAWVALTAAGPFVYLLRRYARSLPDYPKVGDRLWAMLGLPWLLTALLQTRSTVTEAPNEWLATILSVGLAVVSLIALSVVWRSWVVVTPERATQTFSGPWTNRVGLVLAVAWPLQCGLGLVVVG